MPDGLQSNDGQPAHKRARVDSPTPSDATSEETLPTAMVCLPCDPDTPPPEWEHVIEDGERKRKCKWVNPDGTECGTCVVDRKSVFDNHWLSHTKEKRWKCGDCAKRCSRKDKLVQHIKDKHSVDRPFPCGYPGCDHKSKRAGQRKEHWLTHSGDRPFPCPHLDCKYAFKHQGALTQHLAFRHSNERPFKCDRPGCDDAFKQASDLVVHKAHKHDIGVVWHRCEACDYKCPRATTLRVHVSTQHSEAHEARKKKQEERVRDALLAAGFKEWDRTEEMPPLYHFRREKQIDFKCAELKDAPKCARIDFAIGVPGGFVFLEVDENQHKPRHVENPICDLERMKNVELALNARAKKIGSEVPKIYWLRYNPDAWHVGGKTRRYEKVDREANLVAWLKRFECKSRLGIGYAFYDCKAPDGDGALDVMDTPAYDDEYAERAENLMDLV